MVFDGVADEVGIGAEAHFGENPAAVGTDGLGADLKGGGDFGDGASGGEGAQDLVFALAEAFVGQEDGFAGEDIGEVGGELLGDVAAARGDGAEGGGEIRFEAAFGDVAIGAGADGAGGEGVLGVDAEDEDAGLEAGLDGSEEIEAVGIGQIQIQNDQIPWPGGEHGESLGGGGGGADLTAGQYAFDDEMEPLANDVVVVDEQDGPGPAGAFRGLHD